MRLSLFTHIESPSGSGGMHIKHVIVLSIGNPAPYLNTRHSVGHLAIEVLRRELDLPAFTRSKQYGKASLVTSGVSPRTRMRYTLAQSPTLMNVSGPWVKKVWDTVLANNMQELKETDVHDAEPSKTQLAAASTNLPQSRVGLVIMHDELEQEMGNLHSRPLTRSARGHNGLRSIKASMASVEFPGAPWATLSVGIGRPSLDEASRSSRKSSKTGAGGAGMDIAQYVLQQMTMEQREQLQGSVQDTAMKMLSDVEDAWVHGPAATKTPKPPKQKRSG
ncbi:peptidyl-trna hydrolase [Ophiostoma piceae UAMH 11346]|uniref:peptidyl-tRNA hydrolase n=1 Tax=Ophiostoma piceae (strain UAMH 11346) TaxID=1262450 RepID=S3D577_OPHP1|nr:peptidyl-trna hydrolase [Ophiostoma piceae UAMH 11346]